MGFYVEKDTPRRSAFKHERKAVDDRQAFALAAYPPRSLSDRLNQMQALRQGTRDALRLRGRWLLKFGQRYHG